MSAIEQKVIRQLRKAIINQSRYMLPSDYANAGTMDDMSAYADTMTDLETNSFLTGKLFISDGALLTLADTFELENLFGRLSELNDANISKVETYIMENKSDCEDLWQHILHSVTTDDTAFTVTLKVSHKQLRDMVYVLNTYEFDDENDEFTYEEVMSNERLLSYMCTSIATTKGKSTYDAWYDNNCCSDVGTYRNK